MHCPHGPSGCGKSSLAKLLQGFYQLNEGSIKLDGHDIPHLSANDLRSCFGVVPQETARRRAFTKPSKRCRRVTRPRSANTERDYQEDRSSVSPLRALLKRPPILIFDEATSNLMTKRRMRLGRRSISYGAGRRF